MKKTTLVAANFVLSWAIFNGALYATDLAISRALDIRDTARFPFVVKISIVPR